MRDLNEIFGDKSEDELATIKLIYEANENNFEKALAACLEIFTANEQIQPRE